MLFYAFTDEENDCVLNCPYASPSKDACNIFEDSGTEDENDEGL